MEKLNNTAKVLTELYNSLDNLNEIDVMNLSIEADNVESAINMASAFTASLDDFEKQQEIITGYRVMSSVLTVLKSRIDDIYDKLFDINRRFREIL